MLQVIFSHMNQPPPDVSDMNPDIPFELAEAIEKAMEKDPEERFQSVTEFGAALLA